MRIAYLLPLLVFAACSSPEQEQQPVPTALQQDGVVADIKGSISGRGYGKDLVDALFQDVLSSDTALRHLLDDLERQLVLHGDSTEAYHRFESQNRSYYEAATEHTAVLSDSMEREAQRALLRASEEQYNGIMAGSRQLDDQYEAVRKRTSELVELIKLQRTRELMETYQRNERPGDEALKAELQRIRMLEQRLNEALRR